MIIWGADVVPLVSEIIGCRADFGECVTAGVTDREGNLIAAVVFHNWAPDTGVMEVSAAAVSPRWATRGHLSELFGYAFKHAQMCVARIHEDNERARRLWRSFGAEEYILPRMRGRMASEAVQLLTDDAWAESKYMRQEHGQTQGTQAA